MSRVDNNINGYYYITPDGSTGTAPKPNNTQPPEEQPACVDAFIKWAENPTSDNIAFVQGYQNYEDAVKDFAGKFMQESGYDLDNDGYLSFEEFSTFITGVEGYYPTYEGSLEELYNIILQGSEDEKGINSDQLAAFFATIDGRDGSTDGVITADEMNYVKSAGALPQREGSEADEGVVTVDPWSDEERDNNCLSRIINNNYDLAAMGIKLYSEEYFKLETMVRNANPNIFNNGDILHTGDTVYLPGIGNVEFDASKFVITGFDDDEQGKNNDPTIDPQNDTNQGGDGAPDSSAPGQGENNNPTIDPQNGTNQGGDGAPARSASGQGEGPQTGTNAGEDNGPAQEDRKFDKQLNGSYYYVVEEGVDSCNNPQRTYKYYNEANEVVATEVFDRRTGVQVSKTLYGLDCGDGITKDQTTTYDSSNPSISTEKEVYYDSNGSKIREVNYGIDGKIIKEVNYDSNGEPLPNKFDGKVDESDPYNDFLIARDNFKNGNETEKLYKEEVFGIIDNALSANSEYSLDEKIALLQSMNEEDPGIVGEYIAQDNNMHELFDTIFNSDSMTDYTVVCEAMEIFEGFMDDDLLEEFMNSEDYKKKAAELYGNAKNQSEIDYINDHGFPLNSITDLICSDSGYDDALAASIINALISGTNCLGEDVLSEYDHYYEAFGFTKEQAAILAEQSKDLQAILDQNNNLGTSYDLLDTPTKDNVDIPQVLAESLYIIQYIKDDSEISKKYTNALFDIVGLKQPTDISDTSARDARKDAILKTEPKFETTSQASQKVLSTEAKNLFKRYADLRAMYKTNGEITDPNYISQLNSILNDIRDSNISPTERMKLLNMIDVRDSQAVNSYVFNNQNMRDSDIALMTNSKNKYTTGEMIDYVATMFQMTGIDVNYYLSSKSKCDEILNIYKSAESIQDPAQRQDMYEALNNYVPLSVLAGAVQEYFVGTGETTRLTDIMRIAAYDNQNETDDHITDAVRKYYFENAYGNNKNDKDVFSDILNSESLSPIQKRILLHEKFGSLDNIISSFRKLFWFDQEALITDLYNLFESNN